ncbi:MAG TPA: AAA domain-containing protein, partial [Lentisphaeria bacterium]|nr:AAA domain-containing protein [Lentisphaeria bacterium]
IISYVRSGGKSIGFVDDPNRVNVTHTRCRREMVVIGDLEHLKHYAQNRIFARMERAFRRDGVIEDLTADSLAAMLADAAADADAPAGLEPGVDGDSERDSETEADSVPASPLPSPAAKPQQLMFDF